MEAEDKNSTQPISSQSVPQICISRVYQRAEIEVSRGVVTHLHKLRCDWRAGGLRSEAGPQQQCWGPTRQDA